MIVKADLVENDLSKVSEPTQLIDKKTGKLPTNIQVNTDEDSAISSSHENILVFMLLASLSSLPLFWWFGLMFAVGMLWWAGFVKFHNWKMWLTGFIVFIPTLLMYFVYLERALPSNI